MLAPSKTTTAAIANTPVATCTNCGAEIIYAELERASIAVCANCGEPVELVTVIEDLVEAAAVEVAGTRQRRLGSHGKTPVLSGALPRCWHSTMLREDEESFSLNQLWVVQGRLGRAWVG